jgi:hypothetical protein
LSNVVDVAAGWYHGLALRRDGTVASWGYNTSGQAIVPADLSNVVSVAAGFTHSLALTRDGTVVGWGAGYITNVPQTVSNVLAIAAGSQHALALLGDGTVVGWGVNSSGQTTVPPWLTNVSVVAISGGTSHSLALLNDGSPYIGRQPWTQTIFSGMNVEFTVAALGRPPFSYQWQLNGTNIPGATNSVLQLTSAHMNSAGNYRCIVTNTIGSITSLPATLNVLPPSLYFIPALSGFDTNGNFSLYLAGASGGENIVLFASTNLIDWQPIFTNPPVSGNLILTDPAATNLPQRFYRFGEQ